MTDIPLNLESLVNIFHKAGRPVHINVLTRKAARAWLEARREERHYVAGARYEPGETLLFEGRWATVESVQAGWNPLQGDFAILTLCFPDGAQSLMAAEIRDAPMDDQRLITDEQGKEILRERQAQVRQDLQSALSNDSRFVSCETSQGEFWCLGKILPEVTVGELQKAVDYLSDELKCDEIVSHTIESLARVIWGLENDGSDDYALYTFALWRILDTRDDVINLGDRWTSAQAWQAFTSRPTLTSPRIASDVRIPNGVEMSRLTDTERERCQKAAGEAEKEKEETRAMEQETEDLETWRTDHPNYAIFTLRAQHYYEGWLPLSKSIRALFPPLRSGRQEVIFHHHFGDELGSFSAWVDHDSGRIWVSRRMYATFRNHRIYPGARLRIVARNEREFGLTTREADKSEPIRVWRMLLNEDGEIEYEDFEEPRRYEVDDDVYVADVRFEDREALFAQAEEVGNSVFGLMYKQTVEWWEQGDREPLTVTADDLFEAIHFDEQGRMVSKATIAWELWKRLAFRALGGGCYRFRPEFGSETRSAIPIQRRKTEPPADGVFEVEAYFIFQQRPDSEYADRAGEIYNWCKGIPGALQIVENARFIYYRPREQVFFGTGRVDSIETYAGESGETYYDGHIADYEPWDPPLPLTPDLAQQVSFIESDRLGVGQAGIRKIDREDFDTIIGAYGQKLEVRRELIGAESDEFWNQIAQMEGQMIYTLAQKKPFRVVRVSEKAVTIEIEDDTSSSLARDNLEAAYVQLRDEGEVSRSAIERHHRFNSSYAVAVLACFPDVQFQTRPIRLSYNPKEASSMSALVKKAPPIGEELPCRVAKEQVKELLKSGNRVRPMKSVSSRSLFRVGDYLIWFQCSKFHKKQNQFWFEISKKHFEVVQHLREPIYVLLICGHPERTLVVPFEFLKSIGITSAPVNKNGEWILYVYPSDEQFELVIWFGSGERERLDVTEYLNKYPFDQIASIQSEEQISSFPKTPAVSTGAEPAEDISLHREKTEGQDLGDRISTEFQQIRDLIQDSLVGKTIYTLGRNKPNRIISADEEGLSVRARNTRKVLWRWIKGVYEALVRLGSIGREDVQDGEYQNPDGYRSSFVFPLLAQFSHIDVSTKPRIQLTYREPTGSVSLKSTPDDISFADEVPAADQTQKSLQIESRSPQTEVSGRRDAPPVPSDKTIEGAEEVEDVDTQEAFETLIGELQNALGDTQESIEDAVKQSDFSAARDAAERGEEIQEQIDQLKDLKKQWGNIVGSESATEGAKRAPRGASTPQETYRLPILWVLEEMGGRGRTSEVLDRVGEIMNDQLNKWDRQMLPSGDNIRWRNKAQWARNTMVKEDLLASDSPRGVWEISEKGRAVLRKSRGT